MLGFVPRASKIAMARKALSRERGLVDNGQFIMEDNLGYFSGQGVDTTEKNWGIYSPHPPSKKINKLKFLAALRQQSNHYGRYC